MNSEPEKDAAAGVVAELERVEEMLDGVLKLATAEHRASEGSARVEPASDHKRLAVIDPFPVLQGEVERATPAARLAGSELTLEVQRRKTRSFVTRMNSRTWWVNSSPMPSNTLRGGTHHGGEPADAGSTAVEVSDDGPGLPADQLAASTTRFWRAPQHSRIPPGNGLGMTIVERLAEANGAKLVLEANEPHGLTARLEFARPRYGSHA